MPPLSTYASSLEGSLYIATSKNSSKHGNGSVLIENGVSLFGSSDQYFQSTNVASDLIVDSKKLPKLAPVDCTAVEVSKAGVNTKVKGSFNVDQASTLTGAVVASSTLAVSGVSTLASAVNCQSTLAVTGAVTASNSLTVNQASTLTGAVSCGSTLAVTGTSSHTGASTFASTINVTGASTLVGDVAMSNNLTVTGNLLVNGTTTTIDSQQVLIKDNTIVLNSASQVNKDSGIMFKRSTGLDTTAFWWDESDLTFVLASTDSASIDSFLNVKALQKLKCAGIEGNTISVPGFATCTVSLAGNSAVPVAIPGITQQRGSFEFIIESDSLTGSVFNYKMVKNKAASDSPTLLGVHQSGDDDSQVWVKWDVLNQAPMLYHKAVNALATPIVYKIKYLRVD